MAVDAEQLVGPAVGVGGDVPVVVAHVGQVLGVVDARRQVVEGLLGDGAVEGRRPRLQGQVEGRQRLGGSRPTRAAGRRADRAAAGRRRGRCPARSRSPAPDSWSGDQRSAGTSPRSSAGTQRSGACRDLTGDPTSSVGAAGRPPGRSRPRRWPAGRGARSRPRGWGRVAPAHRLSESEQLPHLGRRIPCDRISGEGTCARAPVHVRRRSPGVAVLGLYDCGLCGAMQMCRTASGAGSWLRARPQVAHPPASSQVVVECDYFCPLGGRNGTDLAVPADAHGTRTCRHAVRCGQWSRPVRRFNGPARPCGRLRAPVPRDSPDGGLPSSRERSSSRYERGARRTPGQPRGRGRLPGHLRAVRRETVISLEIDTPSVPEIQRPDGAPPGDPRLAGLEDDDGIVGYAYGSSYRSRAAYRWACEVSVYVEPGRRRTGAGRVLYEALFARLVDRGYLTALAGMTLPNAASEGLHRRLGFEAVGTWRGSAGSSGPGTTCCGCSATWPPAASRRPSCS